MGPRGTYYSTPFAYWEEGILLLCSLILQFLYSHQGQAQGPPSTAATAPCPYTPPLQTPSDRRQYPRVASTEWGGFIGASELRISEGERKLVMIDAS